MGRADYQKPIVPCLATSNRPESFDHALLHCSIFTTQLQKAKPSLLQQKLHTVVQTSSTTCCTSGWAHGSEPGWTCGFVCLLAEPPKHGQPTAASQTRPQARPQHTTASTLLVLGICSQSGLLALPLGCSRSCLPFFSLLNGFPNLPLVSWCTAQEKDWLILVGKHKAGIIACLI